MSESAWDEHRCVVVEVLSWVGCLRAEELKMVCSRDARQKVKAKAM